MLDLGSMFDSESMFGCESTLDSESTNFIVFVWGRRVIV